MPVTHGSATESGDRVPAFAWTRPSLADLDRSRPAEGTVLSAAVLRAGAERRTPRPTVGGFDNRM